MTEISKLAYDEIIEVNGNKLTKKYIQSLSKEERLAIVDPIFEILRFNGFMYRDSSHGLKSLKSWKKLVEFQPDLNKNELFNNSSLATDICKYFCKKFYSATEEGKPTMIEVYSDDVKLRRLIENRLGLDWLDADERGPGVNEAFNLSFKMMVQGMRSMRLVPSISMFKPDIAKYMYMKYSEPGDTVFDYSAGWGGRMLGARSCGRKYIGVDPLTTDELEEMASYLSLREKPEDVVLINNGSEFVRLEENSVDLAWTSPSYYDQEQYSKDLTQAYNKGEDYFYNTYWKQTLENVRYMLKPGKWFGVNVKNYPKMVDMAIDTFGPVIEEVYLKTVRGHLNKTAGTLKNESIYMFKNNK